MTKLLTIIPLVFLLCFTFGCQDKEAMAELEKFKAQAEVEEQNKTLFKTYFEELNKGNIEILSETCAPEFVFYSPSEEPEPDSLKELIEVMKMHFKGFPDLNFAVQEVVAKGDKVIGRFTVTGTHSGDWNELPATGNKIKVTVIEIWRMKDGKCVESREEGDYVGLWQQLGFELKPKEGE